VRLDKIFVIGVITLGMGVALARPTPSMGQAGVPLPGMMPSGVFLPAEMGGCCQGFQIGAWVEYLVVRRQGNKRWHLRMAAVGREESAWWIELTMAAPRSGEAVCKMLVDHGTGARDDRVRRVIIQPEGHLPLELPVEAAGEHLPPLEAGEGQGKLVGSDVLKLRPGTFETRHYRRGEGDDAHHIWLSDKVALWGLARYRSPRVTLTLLAQGRGASTRIIGEPVPFDPATIR
jgi:hypothetical protein